MLLFGPLAFGAVEPWSIFVLEAGAALLLMLWIIRQVSSGELSVTGNPLFAPMLAFAFCVGLQLATGRTAYRYETFSAALLYCAYGILCFLVIQVLRRTSQVQALTVTFSVYGFLLASFALLQGLSSTTRLYWLRTPRIGGWIYGPYVNHNHYAGLMEMLLPIPLVFSLTRGARGPRKIMAGIAAALMASTIFLSGSRGGMLAFVVQIGVLAVVVFWRQKNRKVTWALLPFLVIGVGLVLWLGGSELAQRLATIHAETRTELSGGTRLDIDRDALRMFARKPVLGWGLGVFPDVYPQFRSFHTVQYLLFNLRRYPAGSRLSSFPYHPAAFRRSGTPARDSAPARRCRRRVSAPERPYTWEGRPSKNSAYEKPPTLTRLTIKYERKYAERLETRLRTNVS